MAKVKIVADSTCDLPITTIKNLDIEIIPANVIFEDHVFSHYDISNEEFYQRQKNGEMSSTGVPSPKVFKTAFDNALKTSDEIIVFTLSKKLSAMYQTATLVVNNFFDERVTIIDSETVTLEMGLITYLAAMQAKDGASKEELLNFINDFLIPHSQLLGVVDTLRYLKRSGRISTISWLIGSVLSIKPIVRIEDGLIKSPGKVRGKEHALEILKSVADKIVANKKSDTIVVGHSHDLERALEFEKLVKELPNAPTDVLIGEIGPVVGTHLGPGAIGFAWIGDYKDEWIK
ncbi:MAG: DegV family protein [Asgard group archaeon]|nr:DegV family protein [Asgard group archaeon]